MGKKAFKTKLRFGKALRVVSTVALASAGSPPAGLAAKKVKEVVEVVETVDSTRNLLKIGLPRRSVFDDSKGDVRLDEPSTTWDTIFW